MCKEDAGEEQRYMSRAWKREESRRGAVLRGGVARNCPRASRRSCGGKAVTGCDSYGRDQDEADVRRIAVDELIKRYEDGQNT